MNEGIVRKKTYRKGWNTNASKDSFWNLKS
jgi:hypothetical protein